MPEVLTCAHVFQGVYCRNVHVDTSEGGGDTVHISVIEGGVTLHVSVCMKEG